MLPSRHNCRNLLRTSPKPVEPNPKTLPLDKVVERIDDKILAYYLEQVSLFLKNNKKDLWFPKLTPYLDAFLVRVIRDVQNIENLLNVFDSKSRAFAQDIIESLIQNEDVYSLTYSYENSRIETDTLVYRKVFMKKGSKPMVTKNSESLYAKNDSTKPPDKPAKKNPGWVKVTLMFITDDNWTLMEYPVMSYNEAELVHSVVKLQCNDVSNLGPLCEDLVDAIKDLNRTMELKSSFLYINSKSKEVQLSIEKIPLKSNGVEWKLQLPIRNTINKPELKPSTPKIDPKTKAEKTLLNRKQLIDSLNKAFINTTLKTIFNFISTESEASLVFKNANENQCMFIQTACAMARTPKFYSLFANDSRQILKDIAKVLTANQWYELKVDVAKVQKDNKLRTVSLVKHPKDSYETKSLPKPKNKLDSANSSFSGRSKSLDRKNLPKKAVAFESGGKLEQVVGGILVVKKENQPQKATDMETISISSTDSRETLQNIAKRVNKQQNSEKENILPSFSDDKVDFPKLAEKLQTRPSRAEFKDQSSSDAKRAKSVPPQMLNKDSKDVKQKVDGRKLCLSKLKLLQAMSIPMESDIAMRMMNQMGWDGGPLGLRGEGITEPIIPALHLAPKAGLGHVKPDSKATSAFRLDFLQHLSLLLTQEKLEHKIVYEKPLVNQQIKYIMDTMKLLNNRKKISEGEEEIKVVLGGIIEELFCEPDLQISCDVKPDKKQVILQKKILDTKRKSTVIKDDRDTTVMQICTNLPNVISTDNAKRIGLLYDHKTALKTGIRIILQYTVMDFLKCDLTVKRIKFNFDLPNKSVNFLKNMLVKINQRNTGNQIFHTYVEQLINIDALKYSKGVQITLDMEAKQTLILRKTPTQNYAPQNCMELIDLTNNNSNIVNKNKVKETTNTKQDLNKDDNTDITESIVNKNKDIETVKSKQDLNKDNKTDITEHTCNITDDMNDGTENIDITSDSLKDNIKIEQIDNDNNASGSTENEPKYHNDSFELKEMEKELDFIDKFALNYKRNRSDSPSSNNAIKKTKIIESVTYFFITPNNGSKMSNGDVKKFQTAVSDQIDVTTKLPLLECHGVDNGALIYGCHNEIGMKLIQGVASQLEFTTKEVENYREDSRQKLKFKLNSSNGVNLIKLFNSIECYNIGLSVDAWAIEDVDVFDDFIVILVEVDNASFEYILEANFRLFVGTDRIRISLVWD